MLAQTGVFVWWFAVAPLTKETQAEVYTKNNPPQTYTGRRTKTSSRTIANATIARGRVLHQASVGCFIDREKRPSRPFPPPFLGMGDGNKTGINSRANDARAEGMWWTKKKNLLSAKMDQRRKARWVQLYREVRGREYNNGCLITCI